MEKTVLITGGTGLIGLQLSRLLQEKGYQVRHLSRRRNLQAEFPAYQWNIQRETIDKEAFDGVDYIVHLAGASLAAKRWTAAYKQVMLDSRIKGTALLINTIKSLPKRPKAFISASAIGFYGNAGEQWMDETASPATGGFMSECCVLWEKSAQSIPDLGLRLAILRIGIVLSSKDGALQKMMASLPLRVAAYFGDGETYYSWIHIDDMCRLFCKAIEDEAMKGIFNAVAPNPVKNKILVKTLIEASGKQVMMVPAPAFALRLAMGEMSQIVLEGSRASAQKIQEQGFDFQYPELLPALKDILENGK